MNFLKALLVLLFVTSLAGCDQVIDTQPYLVGTFAGTYQPGNPEDYINDVNPPMLPITVESRLVSVTSTRYDFTGTVNLNGEVYSMTGYEESKYGDLAYLKPQARGVFGQYLMNLKNETGTAYSVCGSIFYGSAGFYVSPEDPRLYDGYFISGNAESWDKCISDYDATEGAINYLEKR